MLEELKKQVYEANIHGAMSAVLTEKAVIS